MSRAVYDAWHDAGPVERFHRHAQDRLRATWPTLANALDAMPRAAGGQEKPNCPLTDSGLEHRPHHYLTPVPWDCPGLPAAPIGGQAEPSDAGYARAVAVVDAIPMDPEDDPSQSEYEQAMAVGFNIALAKVHRDLDAAAPVGGQVEPSDAQRMLDAIRRVVPLNAELRHDGSEDPGMAAYVEGVNAAYDAAAAVSGEQT